MDGWGALAPCAGGRVSFYRRPRERPAKRLTETRWRRRPCRRRWSRFHSSTGLRTGRAYSLEPVAGVETRATVISRLLMLLRAYPPGPLSARRGSDPWGHDGFEPSPDAARPFWPGRKVVSTAVLVVVERASRARSNRIPLRGNVITPGLSNFSLLPWPEGRLILDARRCSGDPKDRFLDALRAGGGTMVDGP